jgi:WD40 repeat protein
VILHLELALLQIVYYTAGVAVVYSPRPDHDQHGVSSDKCSARNRTQHFFLGHDDDIKCLAVCPADIVADGSVFPAYSVFASGQVTSTAHGPYVCVWDSRVGSQQGSPEIQRLELPKSARGVCALAFSPDGHFLTVVAMDNPHSVTVYNWQRSQVVGQGRGFCGEFPQVSFNL